MAGLILFLKDRDNTNNDSPERNPYDEPLGHLEIPCCEGAIEQVWPDNAIGHSPRNPSLPRQKPSGQHRQRRYQRDENERVSGVRTQFSVSLISTVS
jgi:hypothetical protein